MFHPYYEFHKTSLTKLLDVYRSLWKMSQRLCQNATDKSKQTNNSLCYEYMKYFNNASIRVITGVYSKRNCTIFTLYQKKETGVSTTDWPRVHVLYCDMPTKVLHSVITALCKSFSVSLYSIPLLLVSLLSVTKHETPHGHTIHWPRGHTLHTNHQLWYQHFSNGWV
jgi:prepilin signal peptidase PulO-like enzyme (type II secretory pathway)